MKVQKSFKFELMPDGSQIRSFAKYSGCRRVIFNKGLALQNQRYQDGLGYLGYSTLSGEVLRAWKSELPWLAECHSQVLQQALKDLDFAFKRFFNKLADKPVFKKKGLHDSFRFPQIKPEAIDEANSRIKLPKLGWIRYRKSRKIIGIPKNITISRLGEKWFVSIQTEQTLEAPLPASLGAVGVDMGVARFATFSDGGYIDPVNALRKKQVRLARYQRALARKVKFSQNWLKAKKKISKLHIDVANARADFLHKSTTTISKNHAMIAIEDLKVSNMSASARGTTEQPGKNVKAKSGLNRSILDQGWHEFRRQLEYKAAWQGGLVIAVPPQYTSQLCPCCGHTHKDNRKTQVKFECVECGYTENADVVGAKNILARAHQILAAGHAASACREELLGSSAKQEPAEAPV